VTDGADKALANSPVKETAVRGLTLHGPTHQSTQVSGLSPRVSKRRAKAVAPYTFKAVAPYTFAEPLSK
jgi:hypothetical protein